MLSYEGSGGRRQFIDSSTTRKGAFAFRFTIRGASPSGKAEVCNGLSICSLPIAALHQIVQASVTDSNSNPRDLNESGLLHFVSKTLEMLLNLM
jgi:hypothetical protein